MNKPTKKQMIVSAAIVAVLGIGGLAGYKPVHPSATCKATGCDSLACCQAGCSGQGCFCNRSCFITWCWGPWYCQCG
jgi:hypothetical protein